MPKQAKPEDKAEDVHAQMHKKDNEKRELQKKYMQFQLARQYLTALAEERAAIEAKLGELAMTAASMRNIKELKKNEEIWSTLGSDVFVTSDMKDASTPIVGVGAGVYVKKPIDDAIKTIEARHAELAEVYKQISAEIDALSQQLTKLEPEIQAAAAQFEQDEKE